MPKYPPALNTAGLFTYFCLKMFILLMVMLLLFKFVNWMFVFFNLSTALVLFVLYFIGIMAESNRPLRDIKCLLEEFVSFWSVLTYKYGVNFDYYTLNFIFLSAPCCKLALFVCPNSLFNIFCLYSYCCFNILTFPLSSFWFGFVNIICLLFNF